jgi:hypothetical protein
MATVPATRFRITKTSAIRLAVVALYVALMVVAQVRHEPWRDEIHCWMVGRDADGLMGVLFGERRYDGHPFLWYWLLNLVSHASRAPAAMQVLTVGCTAITAYLVMFRSPFASHERVLLLFSHYFVYEYAVVCRSYVVGVLLVCVFCALYDPRRVRYGWLAFVLVLLVAVSAYSALVAGALALFLFVHHLEVHRDERRPTFWALAFPRAALLGLFVFCVGVAFVGVTTIPPADAYFDNPWNGGSDKYALYGALNRFLIGLAPIPPTGTVEVWNHSIFDTLGKSWSPRLPWIGLALLVLWIVALARRPFLAIPFVVGVVLMAGFQNYKYMGAVRHWGHFSLLLVACVWLSRKAGPNPRKGWRFQSILFSLNMAVQVYSGFVLIRADLSGTFSGAKDTAAYIINAGLRDEPFVGAADHPVSAVAGYLDRELVFPETGEHGQRVIYHNRRKGASSSDLLAVAAAEAERTGKDPVIISNFPISARRYKERSIVLLYESPKAIVFDENFRVYRMQR